MTLSHYLYIYLLSWFFFLRWFLNQHQLHFNLYWFLHQFSSHWTQRYSFSPSHSIPMSPFNLDKWFFNGFFTHVYSEWHFKPHHLFFSFCGMSFIFLTRLITSSLYQISIGVNLILFKMITYYQILLKSLMADCCNHISKPKQTAWVVLLKPRILGLPSPSNGTCNIDTLIWNSVLVHQKSCLLENIKLLLNVSGQNNLIMCTGSPWLSSQL